VDILEFWRPDNKENRLSKILFSLKKKMTGEIAIPSRKELESDQKEPENKPVNPDENEKPTDEEKTKSEETKTEQGNDDVDLTANIDKLLSRLSDYLTTHWGQKKQHL